MITEKNHSISVDIPKSTPIEKVMYGIGDVGANFCLSFIMGFATMYYTNSVGISAAVVGTMMLISRLTDGFTDIIMGIIIEKTNTRFGKVRPWIGISAPLMAIAIIACFNIPADLTDSGKVFYMYVSFIMTVAIVTTIYNMAIVAILPRISLDPHDQNKAVSIRGIILSVGVAGLYTLTTKLLAAFGGTNLQQAWSKVSHIYAVVCLVVVLLFFLSIKEKVPSNIKTEDKLSEDKMTVGEFFKAVLKIPHGARYAFLLFLIFFLCYTMNGLTGSMAAYYFSYVIGNFETYSLQTSIGMITTVIVLLSVIPLMKRFGRRKVLTVSLLTAIIAGMARLIAPTTVSAYVVLAVLFSTCIQPVSTAMWTLVPELVDYVYQRSGIRAEGVVSSAAGVGIKLGQGVGAASVGWILAAGGFDGLTAVQPQSAITAIIVGTIVVPTSIALLLMICHLLWNIDKHFVVSEDPN